VTSVTTVRATVVTVQQDAVTATVTF